MASSGAERVVGDPPLIEAGELVYNPALALQNIQAAAANLGIDIQESRRVNSQLLPHEVMGMTKGEADIIMPLAMGLSDEMIATKLQISEEEVASLIEGIGVKFAGNKLSREGIAVLAKSFAQDPASFEVPQEVVLQRLQGALDQIGSLLSRSQLLVQEIESPDDFRP